MKILLVDDSGTMRTIQKRCLLKLGIEDVTEAEDGVQALEIFKNNTFDIVLSDFNILGFDGLQVLGIVKEIDHYGGVFRYTVTMDPQTFGEGYFTIREETLKPKGWDFKEN